MRSFIGSVRAVRSPRIDVRAQLAVHWPFLLVVLAGAVLRGLAVYAVRPALEFVQDSFYYLYDAAHPALRDVVHPVGYAEFLRFLNALSARLTVVPVAQHCLALLAAVAIYALVIHRGAGRWLATLSTVPLLLTGYQITLEHFVLSDSLFEFLLIGSVVALLWPERPTAGHTAVAAALLGAASLTRTVGLAVVPVFVLYLLLRRGVRHGGWRPLVAGGLVLAIMVGGYAVWFERGTGTFGLDAYDGYFLAARVEPFADCSGAPLTDLEARLCPQRPVASRPGPDTYVWDPGSPLRNPHLPAGIDRNALALSYARTIIAHQPGDYAASVLGSFAGYFTALTPDEGIRGRGTTWLFPTSVPRTAWKPEYPPSDPYIWEWSYPGPTVVIDDQTIARHGFGLRQVHPFLDPGIAGFLRGYGRVAYLPGPLLALAWLAGLAPLLAGAATRVHSVLTRRRDASLAASPADTATVATLAAAATLLLLVTCASADRDPRYLLPAEMLAWPAAMMMAPRVRDVAAAALPAARSALTRTRHRVLPARTSRSSQMPARPRG